VVTELVDLWPPNSPDVNPSGYKIWGIIQQGVYRTKVQDVNDLMQRLVDMWVGLKQSVLDDAIDQRPTPGFEPRVDILNIHCDKLER